MAARMLLLNTHCSQIFSLPQRRRATVLPLLSFAKSRAFLPQRDAPSPLVVTKFADFFH